MTIGLEGLEDVDDEPASALAERQLRRGQGEVHRRIVASRIRHRGASRDRSTEAHDW